MKESQRQIQNLLKNPCTSFWMKNALLTLLERDIVDALDDSEELHRLMRLRWDEASEKYTTNNKGIYEN